MLSKDAAFNDRAMGALVSLSFPLCPPVCQSCSSRPLSRCLFCVGSSYGAGHLKMAQSSWRGARAKRAGVLPTPLFWAVVAPTLLLGQEGGEEGTEEAVPHRRPAEARPAAGRAECWLHRLRASPVTPCPPGELCCFRRR